MDYLYYRRLLVSILGIYVVYLTYGVVQEKIYRYISSDGSRFKYTTVLLIVQCTINLVISSIFEMCFGERRKEFSLQIPKCDLIGRFVILKRKERLEKCVIKDVDAENNRVQLSFDGKNEEIFEFLIRDTESIRFLPDSLMDYWIYGVCYTLAMVFSNSALKHVNYPTQVLAKSCKMIPVLLAGTLFGTRQYTIQKYISVFIITSGILLFQLVAPKKRIHDEANSSLGIVLLAASLCMDGICGMQQDIVVPRYKPSALRLQQMLNVFGVFVSFFAALLLGELVPGITFLLQNRQCLRYAVQFGIYSSVGQMFILYTVRHFPPLVLSTITTTRKFFSILLSVLFMGNRINVYQWVGVVLVFFGIMYDKIQTGKKKAHGN